jgi:hypothetical protein
MKIKKKEMIKELFQMVPTNEFFKFLGALYSSSYFFFYLGCFSQEMDIIGFEYFD